MAFHLKYRLASFVLACALAGSAAAAVDDQSTLKPQVNAGSDLLHFDWPILSVGTGEYAEGPTGVTVFRFARKVYSAIDVRGGGPGTVNSDYMRLGYNIPELDTVVFAGGSWYGLEAVTAVASALKDDGIRDGNAFSLEPSIAMSVGSIIFDLGGRRLNEIYPDKPLAQAAFRAAKPGVFPLDAEGAGRFAMTGWLFGCNAYSGQGGAFRQFDDLKIAAFTVVNALGVVTTRDGHVAACYGDKDMPADMKTADLLAKFPEMKNLKSPDRISEGRSKNTTISLIVVNQKLDPADLQRLAVQVHTSMARGIQPFATVFDGDVLYAVSTAEIDKPGLTTADIGTLAGEVMWDAILSAAPKQPQIIMPNEDAALKVKDLRRLAGDYVFSRFAALRVTEADGKLYGQAVGLRKVYAIGKERAVELQPVSANEFTVPGRYPLTLRFDKAGRLVVNPGHWQQVGLRKTK